MSAIAFLLVALLLSGIGSAVLVLRNRRPTSVESGIDDFRREMNALAPPDPVSLPPRTSEWDDPGTARAGRDEPSARSSSPAESSEPVVGSEAASETDGPESSPADPRPHRREREEPRSPDEPGAP